MKRGFTLIEMMAASIIFIGILLIAIPSIMNQINEKKSDISTSTLDIIYNAAKLYMDDYGINKSIDVGSSYCVSLDKLVNDEYLDSPIMDPVSRKEISLTKYVKATLNPNKEFTNFELVDTNCNNQ